MSVGPVNREAAKRWFVFAVGESDFGIDLSKVHDTMVVTNITSMPWAAAKVEGEIHLGSKGIPVIDLRDTFRCEKREGIATNIVIVEVQNPRMAKCWEVNNCAKTNCPARENKDLRCWVVPRTLCRNEIQGTFHKKIEACQRCSFFETAYASGHVYSVGLAVDRFVKKSARFRTGDIREVPEAIGGAKHFQGLVHMQNRTVVLLDVDQLFESTESD